MRTQYEEIMTEMSEDYKKLITETNAQYKELIDKLCTDYERILNRAARRQRFLVAGWLFTVGLTVGLLALIATL